MYPPPAGGQEIDTKREKQETSSESGNDQQGNRSLEINLRHEAYGSKVDKENQPAQKQEHTPKCPNRSRQIRQKK
jgi:hypothetical protein